jgi:hypothetical protein
MNFSEIEIVWCDMCGCFHLKDTKQAMYLDDNIKEKLR